MRYQFFNRPSQYNLPNDQVKIKILAIEQKKYKCVYFIIFVSDGPYKAVILEFNLKTCCYATMAMRELAKCETSTSSQALLTNQVREDNVAAKRRKEEDVSREQEEGKKEEEKGLVDSENSVLNNELVTNEIPQISRSMAGETIEEEIRNNAELDNMLNKNMDTNLCSTHM